MSLSFVLTRLAAGLSLFMHQRKMLLLPGSIMVLCVLVYAVFKQNKKYKSAHYNSLQKIRQHRISVEKASKNKAQKKDSAH